MDFAAFIAAVTSVFTLTFNFATGVDVTLGQLIIFTVIGRTGIRWYFSLRG
jgi:hypothetical protein